MATPNTNGVAPACIKATYGSPDGNNTFRQPISSPQPTDTKSKGEYMNSLRSATKSLQNNINEFLTAKMEQDKQAAAQGTTNGTKKPRDEEEEENYGEEVIEDD